MAEIAKGSPRGTRKAKSMTDEIINEIGHIRAFIHDSFLKELTIATFFQAFKDDAEKATEIVNAASENIKANTLENMIEAEKTCPIPTELLQNMGIDLKEKINERISIIDKEMKLWTDHMLKTLSE
ncbi:MAG TPA: hypothetical protein ENG14_04295 [Thermodesulforhabdus norvegica]|uniref:Uncharacterized protein n=1 Tax=Thermodesulforhabdus norvegica TaxID=39841 RepID=A0A7C0WS99_9BACT|nr:hypothetical protein [Thermodesulforhabdus norvegica]